MSKNLLDLSGKIDDLTGGLFVAIASVATSLGIPFFVVGATARDMILSYGYGIQTIRATYDIDFGEGWCGLT
jgi:predicted nucleotidyltransferase